jgi:hypothetical protein
VRSRRVPSADASPADLWQFASFSYYGYDRHGGVEKLMTWAAELRARWESTGEVPERLDHLRAALFSEARSAHWGSTTAAEWVIDPYVEVLLKRIREISGDVVHQDHDGPSVLARRSINRLLRRT